jgi:hypothetical protein
MHSSYEKQHWLKTASKTLEDGFWRKLTKGYNLCSKNYLQISTKKLDEKNQTFGPDQIRLSTLLWDLIITKITNHGTIHRYKQSYVLKKSLNYLNIGSWGQFL